MRGFAKALDVVRQIGLHLGKLAMLLSELISEGELTAIAMSLIGCEPASGIGQAQTIALLLVLEAGQRVLEAGDCAERRHRDRQIDLIVSFGTLQDGGVVVTILAEALARELKIEAADRGDDDLALLLELHEGEDLLEQRPTGLLALGIAPVSHADSEGLAGCRHQPHDVLPDRGNAAGRMVNVAFRIAKLPAHGMLVVDMGGAQPFEPCNVGLQTRLLHQALIATRDGFRHRELVGLAFAHILQPAN